MVAPLVAVAGRAGFQLVRKNSGKILEFIGIGTALTAAYDWFTGDEDDENRKELIEELHEVRTALAEPGLDPQEAVRLATRDSEIQDELDDLGIEVRATFGDAETNEAANRNIAAARAAGLSAPSITPGANITSADLTELNRLNSDLQLVAGALRIPQSALPGALRSMKRLMAYEYQQLVTLEKALS
jgi:hypothetical protein